MADSAARSGAASVGTTMSDRDSLLPLQWAMGIIAADAAPMYELLNKADSHSDSSHLMDAAAMPSALRTPMPACFGPDLASTPTAAKSPNAVGMPVCTPERNAGYSCFTPPAFSVRAKRRDVDEDVEMALNCGSVSLLSAALSRSRLCGVCGPGAAPILHEAVEMQNYEAVALLLEQGPRKLLHEEFGGISPLTRVVARATCENFDMVKLILDYGGNPNQGAGPSLDTPLHEASSRGNTLAMRLLLERGGDPNITNHDKATPLHVACRPIGAFHPGNTKHQVVSLLLRSGADPTLMDKYGMTASDYLRQLLQMSSWMYTKVDEKLQNLYKNLGQAETFWVRKTVALASGRGHSDKCFRILPSHVVNLIVGYVVRKGLDG